MRTHSSQQRRTSESSDRLVAAIQPRSWGNPQTDDAVRSTPDFSHVDLFAHAPQRSPIQTKLTVGAPNDVYEQEADRVASQVMSMPDAAPRAAVQREAIEEEELQMKPLADTITPLVQREALPEEEEELQMKSLDTVQREALPEEEEELQMKPVVQREQLPEEEEELQMKPSLQRSQDSGFQTGGNLETQLSNSKGGGSPLSDEVRAFMEPRFGVDFSQVRVHTGEEAVQMNRNVNAQAFAHGQDIYFGAGKAPGNNELTAHELTHVVQQTGAVQRKPNQSNRSQERTQGYAASDAIAIRSASTSPKIQRDPVAAASLGLAAFEAGRSYTNSGSLYHTSNTPSYMHERTPAEAEWETVTTTLHVQAHHPRIGLGDQDFYYRLSYERNGYDIRNAQVDILRDESSGMYTSSFGSTWSGQTHSRPTESVCQIAFNISGEWNPTGRGQVSWWGRLILSATKGSSSYRSFNIGSERNWVWAA